MVNERLRTTSMCLSVGYGARNDPVGGGGLAHLLEHLLMSAPHRDGVSFAERVERLGGHANAETGLECMLFYAQVDAVDADDIGRALMEALTVPRITAENLASERHIVLSELAAARADRSDVVQDLFLAKLFPGHPLGRPVAGTPDEVETLTVSQVLAGHADAFLQTPMAMMVVGPRMPASLTEAPKLVDAPAQPEAIALPAVDARPPAWAEEFSWMCVGGRSPGLDKTSCDFEVLAHLLGGSPSSLLYRILRVEKGLAYMFQAWNRSYNEAGAWRVLAGAEPANCAAVVGAVVECLERLAAGQVNARDIQAARLQARMRLVLDMESPLEYARQLGYRWCAGHDLSPETSLAAFDEVGEEGVMCAAKDILGGLVIACAPEA
jgi:predicted Zn-dependent peptidase